MVIHVNVMGNTEFYMCTLLSKMQFYLCTLISSSIDKARQTEFAVYRHRLHGILNFSKIFIFHILLPKPHPFTLQSKKNANEPRVL